MDGRPKEVEVSTYSTPELLTARPKLPGDKEVR